MATQRGGLGSFRAAQDVGTAELLARRQGPTGAVANTGVDVREQPTINQLVGRRDSLSDLLALRQQQAAQPANIFEAIRGAIGRPALAIARDRAQRKIDEGKAEATRKRGEALVAALPEGETKDMFAAQPGLSSDPSIQDTIAMRVMGTDQATQAQIDARIRANEIAQQKADETERRNRVLESQALQPDLEARDKKNEFGRKLRNDFEKSSIVVDYRRLKKNLAVGRNAVNKTGDISGLDMVIATSNSMDPGNAVREGEVVVVKDASRLGDKIMGWIDVINNKGLITKGMREDMLAVIEERSEIGRRAFLKEADAFTGHANAADIDPVRVVRIDDDDLTQIFDLTTGSPEGVASIPVVPSVNPQAAPQGADPLAGLSSDDRTRSLTAMSTIDPASLSEEQRQTVLDFVHTATSDSPAERDLMITIMDRFSGQR